MFGNERLSPELLLLAGSSLAGGQTVGQQLGGIGTNVAPLLAQQTQQRQQMEQQNKTLQYLKQTNPQLAAQVEAGMPVSEAWQQVVQAQQPRKRNIISAGDGMFYDVDNGKYITPPADMVQQRNKFGLNTIPGVDAQGNPILLQVNDQGVATQTQMPNGVKISKEPIKLDVGTHFVLLDPITRQPVGTVPKNNAEEQSQIAEGKVLGNTKASLPAVRSTAVTIQKMIADVKNDPYRERATGITSVFNRVPATGGYDFQAKVEQLKGQSFLQAIQQMQGFGALSNQEGQTATAAISRLDTAQSEEAFNKALDDLNEIIDRGVKRVEAMSSTQTVNPSMPADNSQAQQPDTGVVPYTDFFK